MTQGVKVLSEFKEVAFVPTGSIAPRQTGHANWLPRSQAAVRPDHFENGFRKMMALMVISIFLFLSPAFAKELPRDLERAIRSSLETHPDVASAQANMLAARAQVTAGEYRWFPRGDFGVRAGKPGDRYSSAAINQTLWDGGRLDAEFDNTKANESIAIAGKSVTAQDIAIRAAVAYLNVLRTREQLAAAEKNAALHSAMLETVKTRQESGVGVISDVSMATSRLQQARASLEMWRGEVVRSEAAYESVCGERPVGELSAVSDWELNLQGDALMDKVKAQSPILERLRHEVTAAEASVRSKAAAKLPSVNARLERVNYIGAAAATANQSTLFSVSLQWQTDAALTQRYQVEAAEQKVVAARLALQSKERELIETTSSYLQDYQAGKNRGRELFRFFLSADETVGMFQRLFVVGRRSWPEVLNSLQDRYSALGQEIEVRHQTLIARLRLAFILGEMDAILSLPSGQSLAIVK